MLRCLLPRSAQGAGLPAERVLCAAGACLLQVPLEADPLAHPDARPHAAQQQLLHPDDRLEAQLDAHPRLPLHRLLPHPLHGHRRHLRPLFTPEATRARTSLPASMAPSGAELGVWRGGAGLKSTGPHAGTACQTATCARLALFRILATPRGLPQRCFA